MKGPITVVTTFGLGRTAAQVGMLQVLAERGIVADHVVGSSLGAVNAAALAAGRVDDLDEFWNWTSDDVLIKPVRMLARSVSAKQTRKLEGQVREQLSRFLPVDFAALSTPLTLVATDLETGGEVVLDSGDLVDAVMASSALPGLLPPVETGAGPVIDGGLIAGMPLRQVPDDTGTVIVLDTGHSAVDEQTAQALRWWEVGAVSYAHLIRGQAIHALYRTASDKPVVVLSCTAGRMLDFADPDAMVAAGRQVAAEQLDALPARLRKGIYGKPAGLDQFDVLQGLLAR